MRVLFFAPRECWPPTTGAMLRNLHLAREVAREARVTYLSFMEAGGAASAGAGPSSWCEEVVSVPRRGGYGPAKLARGALGRTPVTVLNYTTREMARELGRVLSARDFDVVQVESIHLAAYLPVIRKARGNPLVVLDWHNVESEIMSRYAERAANLFRRAYALRTARQIAALERRALREFDAHVTVSDRDREALLGVETAARVSTVENGVDTAHFEEQEAGRAVGEGGGRRRLVFVGSMDYHANVDAVTHFARETWPRLRERMPGLSFSIVGREPAPEVRELAALPGVEVTGTVEDVRPYYRDALASVVPLRVGGGSRLKILEAMAAGVPVVSTRLGAEGIEAADGEQILLAETAEEFCDAVSGLAADVELRRALVEGGRELVRARYDWSSIGAALLRVYERARAAA